MFGRVNNIHFIGIGGSGMSGIAEVLLNLGYNVTGSDLAETEVTRRLAGLGATIHQGHNAGNIGGAQAVVFSSAIREDNPEIVESRKRAIPMIPRAEMLAELMRMKHGIAVAGAHGKTTTTSMIAHILYHGGLDPTVVIGGRLGSLGSGGRLGRGDYLVAEADESDGTFLKLSPTVAVITNIDREHMDFYGHMDKLKEAFLDFANKVPFYGLTVVCLDDGHIQNLIPRLTKRYRTYGLNTQADLVARDIRQEGLKQQFIVEHQDDNLGEITLNMPGIYNVYNSLAALAVAREIGISFETAAEALSQFSNADRRFQMIGEIDGVTVVDDYAHHPTEIKATLAAARKICRGDLFTVFQPHRYTRTADLMNDFQTAFYDADHLVVTEIYAAGERPMAGVEAEKLCRGIVDHGHRRAVFIKDMEAIADYLKDHLREGDMIITLGAGDIWKLARQMVEGKREDR